MTYANSWFNNFRSKNIDSGVFGSAEAVSLDASGYINMPANRSRNLVVSSYDDDNDSINRILGYSEGDVVILSATNSAFITVVNDDDYINLQGIDFTLRWIYDSIILQNKGNDKWKELSRAATYDYWFWSLEDDLVPLSLGDTGVFTHAGTNRTRVNPNTGLIEAVGANVARFEEVGGYRCLLIEPAGTNYFLNSDAPVTQTTESLATGTYTAWIDGAGSATISANTATITGAGVATDGNPVTFVVTVAGTVDVTIAGGPPDRCQVENGPVRSSYIVTAGAKVTRATESGEPHFTLPSGVFDSEGTAIVWWRPGYGHGDMSAANAGIVSTANAMYSLLYNSNVPIIKTYDATTNPMSEVLNWTADTWYKLIVKWGYLVGGVKKFRVGVDSGGGVVWGSEQTFDGSYTLGTYLRLGYDLFGPMHLRNLMLFRTVLTDTSINEYGGTP